MWREGFFAAALGNVGVGRVRVPQVLRVDRAVWVQALREAQMNLCARRTFDSQRYPPDHVLPHIENVAAIREGIDSLRRKIFYDANRRGRLTCKRNPW